MANDPQHAYAINPADWLRHYAPTKAQGKCQRRMAWVKQPVHGRNLSIRYRHLEQVCRERSVSLASVLGVWSQVKELAADAPTECRPWILNHRREPATAQDIAFATLLDPTDIQTALDILTEVGWLVKATPEQYEELRKTPIEADEKFVAHYERVMQNARAFCIEPRGAFSIEPSDSDTVAVEEEEAIEARGAKRSLVPTGSASDRQDFSRKTFAVKLCDALGLPPDVAARNRRSFGSLARGIADCRDPPACGGRVLAIAAKTAADAENLDSVVRVFEAGIRETLERFGVKRGQRK